MILVFWWSSSNYQSLHWWQKEGIRGEQPLPITTKTIEDLVNGDCECEVYQQISMASCRRKKNFSHTSQYVVKSSRWSQEVWKNCEWCDDNNIKTNLYAGFAAGQQFACEKAGRKELCFTIYSRIDDGGWMAFSDLKQIAASTPYRIDYRNIAASIRRAIAYHQMRRAGAGRMYLPVENQSGFWWNPRERSGLAQFLADVRVK